MLKSITFKEKYRCFNPGDTIPFHDGINLLVGDQGCGKSTIIGCIADMGERKKRNPPPVELVCDGAVTSHYHDFEKMNPRKSGEVHYGWQVAMMWSSHGEAVLAILNGLNREKNCLWLIDEPDMALSIRSIFKLHKLLRDAEGNGSQLIVSVHNPLLISLFDQVYSVEHRRFMSGNEFIELCKQ